jgi:opacity protein-like surface antigen
MKAAAARMILLTFLAAATALAQNSDLAILFGAAGPNSGSVGNGVVTGSFGAGFQLNYAVQLHETTAGQLYLELPLMIAARVNGTVANDVTGSIKDSIFLTPGVRWRFTPQKRVSFYAAGGVGIGSFGTLLSVVGNGSVSNTNARTTTVAFGFGGGIDFRLTRLLSLRAEGRDFVTRSGLGGDSGHSHAFFMAGIGFHF